MRYSLPALTVLLVSAAAAQTAKAPSIDAVVGHYRLQTGAIMTVERSGETVTAVSTGNPPQVLSVTPDGKYAYSSIPGYLTFDLDKAGKATTLHFHFGDESMPAKRIDAAAAKKVADDLAAKIKNQTHDPACAATLKRIIEETRAGKPDYSKMSLPLAQTTRAQAPMIQQRFQTLGAVKEVKFTGVGPQGAERFDVAFENGTTQWNIFCLPNGYVSGVGFR